MPNVWIEATPGETDSERLERLVLHGLKCGKGSLIQLGYHVGENVAGKPTKGARGHILAALARLCSAGKAQQVSEHSWRVA